MKIVQLHLWLVFLFVMIPQCASADGLADQFRSISRMLNGQYAVKTTAQKAKPIRSTYQPLIEQAARRWRIDPLLIYSVIKHESNFNPDAVSNKGACGLMQLMPQTAKTLGVTAVFDPSQNISGGTLYLRLMHDRYGGDLRRMLFAYNAGPTRVDKGRIPRESRIYAAKVLHTYNELRRYSNAN
jgi:soluble lytic murein transglycosylase-like protein